MARHDNVNWTLPDETLTWEQASAAILMDVRDELRQLNRLLRCHNFLAIPFKLERIARNTTKRRRAKSVRKSKT